MDLELSCGCGSKFSTRGSKFSTQGSKFSTQGSNRMLVVKVAIVKLQFFHSGSVLP